MELLSAALMVPATLVAVPTSVLALEIFASLFTRPRPDAHAPKISDAVRLAVLVPAHDESAGIRDTLVSIRAQLRTTDRLLVVADNCSDDTAAIARAAGADVIVRNDPSRIGKGYALDFGLDHLRADPPDVVIVIDADCHVGENALAHMADACCGSGRPVQAVNLMESPGASNLSHSVAALAFRIKNQVRPLGLAVLGLPCQMTGTGMALPWPVAASLTIAGASIVEDLRLGLDLAASGHAPLFCPQARISSLFPWSREGAEQQRQRWERGHLGVIATLAPRLFAKSLSARNWTLLAVVLDASVPPLTFLGFCLVALLCFSAAGYFLGSSLAPLVIVCASALAYGSALLAGWVRFGRDLLPISDLPRVARYIFDKMPFYRRILSRRFEARWVRADRDR